MCGIAGLIHKGKSSSVGLEMTQMLQALKHRGPDSTGYAVYGDQVDDLEPLDILLSYKSHLRELAKPLHMLLLVKRMIFLNSSREQ